MLKMIKNFKLKKYIKKLREEGFFLCFFRVYIYIINGS